MVQQYCKHCRMKRDIQNPREVQVFSESEKEMLQEYLDPESGERVVVGSVGKKHL